MRDLYFKNANCFVVMFSLIDASTFNDLPDLLEQIAKVCDSNLEDIAIILVGNKADLNNQRVIASQQGIILGKQINATYVETSTKLGLNCNFVFQEAIKECFRKGVVKKTSNNFVDIKMVICGSGGVGKV